jgi:hypothetical protein
MSRVKRPPPPKGFTSVTAGEGRRSRSQPAPSRPGLFDHLLVLAGASLSVYLMRLAPIDAVPARPLSSQLHAVFAFMPVLMRIPEGIILLWPFFFAAQWIGRSERLTAGEWLWLLSWVGLVLLTALTAWQWLLGLPDALVPHAAKPRLLWYMLVVPALGGLGLLVLVISLFRSTPAPWTHWLALALMFWSAAPVLLVLAGGEFTAE